MTDDAVWEDFIDTFSFTCLRNHLNKLSPSKTWNNHYNDVSTLGFEHSTKGISSVKIYIYNGRHIGKDVLMSLTSKNDNPNLELINRILHLNQILDGVPLIRLYYLETYPVIAKYLIDNVFDNWLK